MEKRIKVSVLYRVIQHWRAPVFKRLCNVNDIDLKIFYGPDFAGSKVVSTKSTDGINVKKLSSYMLKMKATNGNISMPVSYFLFFNLIYTNPSIVVAEGASNLINALQGFLYAKIFGKKFIWWSLGKLKNNKNDIKRKRIDFLIRYIERKSDAIISYSSVGKEYFKSIGIPEEKIFVAVNVVDTDTKQKLRNNYLERNGTGSGKHDFRVLYVGAITKEKRLDMLIEGFNMFRHHHPEASLDIVGDGPERIAQEKLAAVSGSTNITFHGQLVDNVHEFFINSDVFVLPGLGGLAVSEAMVFGLPVIVSVGDGCEVDLVDESNGYRNPELDADMICKYLEELYSDPVKLSQMKAGSLAKIQNKYNINAYVGKILEAFYYVSKQKN